MDKMCASIFFTHKKFKYYFILLLLLDVSFIFTRTRRVKVPAYFVSFGCCPVKRSADESGNISGPGLLGNRRLGSSWRLFSFMYDAWGSSAAKGGGPPWFSGVSVPDGGSGGHVGTPIHRGGQGWKRGIRSSFYGQVSCSPGSRIRQQGRRLFRPRGVYIWGAQTA